MKITIGNPFHKRTHVYRHTDNTADVSTARHVTTYHDLAHAVMAYDRHVEAWLDGDTLTLAQAAREIYFASC